MCVVIIPYMPQDVITINALVCELKNKLIGKKVLKVHQPEEDELTLSVKSERGIVTLVLSSNPTVPRVHLTTAKKENPIAALAFCMLSRKYLQGGIFTDISLVNFDRIIKFTFNSRNELNDNVNYCLYAELMGRYSNIILTDADDKIIDAIKRVSFEQNATRFILPNLQYAPPKQEKLTIDNENALYIRFKGKTATADALLTDFSGLAKETALEIATVNPLSANEEIRRMLDVSDPSYAPCLRYCDGEPKDYYVRPFSAKAGDYRIFPSLNEAMEEYYSVFDTNLRKHIHTKAITTQLKHLTARLNKRTEECNAKIADFEKAEKNRRYGEFVLANIYKINRGDDAVTCFDYYENCEISVPLDPLLFPNQNAMAYFKKYNKAKKAKEYATEQLTELKMQRIYLDTISASVESAETKQEFDEINAEMKALGSMKKPSREPKLRQKPSKPEKLVIDGFDVYVGKNNIQNVEVTFEIGHSNDLWLHTKNHHGSHCIIKGQNIPPEVIEKAAAVCAYYSTGKNASKVEVDYTQRKNVKKINAAMTGLVTYTNYKTVLVEPKSQKS